MLYRKAVQGTVSLISSYNSCYLVWYSEHIVVLWKKPSNIISKRGRMLFDWVGVFCFVFWGAFFFPMVIRAKLWVSGSSLGVVWEVAQELCLSCSFLRGWQHPREHCGSEGACLFSMLLYGWSHCSIVQLGLPGWCKSRRNVSLPELLDVLRRERFWG